MDSSPPSRSPLRSEYSVDFNAMTQETHDTEQSPLPTRQVDEVRSEDIDGPSDFTLNMEDWMRGKRERKETQQGTISRGGTLGRGSLRGIFSLQPEPRLQETAEEQDFEDHDDDSGEVEEFVDSSLQADTLQPADVASSVWDAYGNPSPLQSTEKRSLQPTVEDYDSELSLGPLRTPAPLRAQSHVHEASRLSQVMFPTAPEETEPSEVVNELEEVRRQLAELQILHESTELKAQLFEEQLRSIQDSRQELHNQLEESNAALETAKLEAKEADNLRRALKTATSEATELKTQLDEMRESEDAELQDLRAQLKNRRDQEDSLKSQVADLKAQLSVSNEEVTGLRAAIPAAKPTSPNKSSAQLEEANQTIAHLREELELMQDLSRLDVPDQEAELASLRAQLEAARSQQQPSDTQADEQLRLSERKRLELHAALDEVRAELQTLRRANADMDERVSASLSKREESWAAREREWEAERRVMVKALLRGWGREECGITKGEKQRYRYQYGVAAR